jgi:hypothetical protein
MEESALEVGISRNFHETWGCGFIDGGFIDGQRCARHTNTTEPESSVLDSPTLV